MGTIKKTILIVIAHPSVFINFELDLTKLENRNLNARYRDCQIIYSLSVTGKMKGKKKMIQGT